MQNLDIIELIKLKKIVLSCHLNIIYNYIDEYFDTLKNIKYSNNILYNNTLIYFIKYFNSKIEFKKFIKKYYNHCINNSQIGGSWLFKAIGSGVNTHLPQMQKQATQFMNTQIPQMQKQATQFMNTQIPQMQKQATQFMNTQIPQTHPNVQQSNIEEIIDPVVLQKCVIYKNKGWI